MGLSIDSASETSLVGRGLASPLPFAVVGVVEPSTVAQSIESALEMSGVGREQALSAIGWHLRCLWLLLDY